jgi:hypothetical protein
MVMLLVALAANTPLMAQQSYQDRQELRIQERQLQQEKWRWEQQNYFDWKNSIQRQR